MKSEEPDGRPGFKGASTCPHCGAEGVGGAEGCNEVFQDVVGREFTRPELFQVHRLTVDAYSLQHPDQYMKSAKSAVAHLIGMCWAMEYEDDPSVSMAISRFLDGTPDFSRPDPGVPIQGPLVAHWLHVLKETPGSAGPESIPKTNSGRSR